MTSPETSAGADARTAPMDAALAAALARIASTPASTTLIDRLDSADWQAGETGPIEAGRVAPVGGAPE